VFKPQYHQKRNKHSWPERPVEWRPTGRLGAYVIEEEERVLGGPPPGLLPTHLQPQRLNSLPMQLCPTTNQAGPTEASLIAG
jgi:hypothetical protein